MSSLQPDCLTTEAGLFEIYINVNFPSFDINTDTSELKSVSETIRISELKQTAISSSNASEVFS